MVNRKGLEMSFHTQDVVPSPFLIASVLDDALFLGTLRECIDMAVKQHGDLRRGVCQATETNYVHTLYSSVSAEVPEEHFPENIILGDGTEETSSP
jgi:hypothetical protein